MTTATTVQQITATDPLLRSINQGLMVSWINADLLNRAHHDIRKSVVFYDEDKMFVTAIPCDPTDDLLSRLFNQTNIRYFSKGIV